jgi:formamidopyrimidine-DNA glycosylase
LRRKSTESDIASSSFAQSGRNGHRYDDAVPELPEMQALSERLDDAFAGARVERVMPLQFSALKTVAPMYDTLNGQRLSGVGRRGKFLVMELERARVLVHLSQGGRVDIEKLPKTTRAKGSVVRFVFPKSGLLVKEFGTERKAAWWVLAPGEEGPLASLGPEPDSKEFADLIRTGTDARRVHTMLRDQHTVAAIGRGYSDDILHRARLSPYASLTSLSEEQRETLLSSVQEVLAEGLLEERKRTGGLPTKVGDHWIVHGRYGTPCPRCGADLRRVSYESHEVTYCPGCQTGGKILADRRMSRLIK